MDENKQKKQQHSQQKFRSRFKYKKASFILGDSMVKDLDRYLLTGSINRKYIQSPTVSFSQNK